MKSNVNCPIAYAGKGIGSTSTEDEIFNLAECARFMRVDSETIKEWMMYGKLPCFEYGEFVLFSKCDLLKWFHDRKQNPPKPPMVGCCLNDPRYLSEEECEEYKDFYSERSTKNE